MDTHDDTCPVCHEIVSVYAIGQCDHPICYKCSTRMRVLCEQMYCAICRSDLPEVLFLKKQKRYTAIDRRDFIPNRKYKILFQDFDCEETYKRLQEHRCKICKDRPVDKSFYALKDHMRRDHTLFCCDLCLQHLKIFSLQRKFYNRRDLATHRRTGDKDDKSYKGHPLCKFCDERYMDNDELLRHLRKDHYFCHFCDEASNEYYSDYENLQQHLKARHYLCEIDNCINVQFTNSFRSNIDLKAHIAKEHHQGMNKAQVKETRMLDVNFHLPPRARGRARGTGLSSEDYEDTDRGQGRGYHARVHGRVPRGGEYGREQREEHEQLERAREVSLREALQKTDKEMRDVEKRRLRAQEVEAQRQAEEERLRQEVASLEKDFPFLAGTSSAQALVPMGLGNKTTKKPYKDTKPQKVVPMAAKVNAAVRLNSSDYPSLGGNSSSSGPHKSSHVGRESPVFNNNGVSNLVQTTAVHACNIQTVPQSVLDSMKKEEGGFKKHIPKRNAEEFPTLGGESQRSKSDINVNLMSLGVWSGKSKKNEPRHVLTVSAKPKQGVPSSLASIGLVVYNGDCSIGKKKSSATPSSTKGSRITASAKSVAVSRDKPVPPSKDKKHESDSKGKIKKKQKEVEPEKTDTAAKVFNNLNDRDSGIESSSGSIDTATVPAFKSEDLMIVETTTRTTSDPPPPMPIPKVSLINSDPVKASLDCIAVGLLGEKQPELADLPASNTPSVLAPPPPGFKPTAPPGFCGNGSTTRPSSSKPPPGFTSQSMKNESTSKKTPTLVKEMENTAYSKPRNFNERNKELVQTVSVMLNNDQEKFGKFKTYSVRFRQGSLDATGYYNSCRELLMPENFDMVVPELIALLPDIRKQQELLDVHQQPAKPSAKLDVLKISGKTTKAPWSGFTDLKPCPSCQQVLLQKDFEAHVSKHNQPDYPSLGSRAPHPGFLGQGSWIKAT